MTTQIVGIALEFCDSFGRLARSDHLLDADNPT